jgi:epoxide hydrolase-like predicted phosphatase
MPREPGLSALIFDFGRVLFRWRPAELLRQVLPELCPDAATTGALVDNFFQGYGGDWGRFDRGDIEVEALTRAIAVRLGLTTDQVAAVIAAVPGELSPIPESVALLRRLHAAGHRLFYLSNMPAQFADHLERSHDFMSCFDAGVFSARVGLVKPEPAIFELALHRFGLAAGEAIFLDDHPANVAAARAIGLRAVQFADAAQASRELVELGIGAAAAA